MNKAKPDSLRTIAKKFGTSHRAIDDLKKSGVDITDDAQVILKLSNNPAWVPPDGLCSPKKKAGRPKKKASVPQALGLRAAIDRLRQAELEAHSKFISAASLAEEQRYLKVWQTTLEQLRKIEESQPDIESANSQSISKEELAQVLGTLFRNLRQDLDALPDRIALLGQNTTEEILAGIVAGEVGKIIDSLHNCKLLNAQSN